MDFSVVALRSLVEVSNRGTMTAAAEALGYTPGAISQHIASLSRACGRPVVVQAGRRVKLTDAGKVLLEHARRVLESEAIAVDALAVGIEGVGGALSVGAFESSSVILGEVIAGLRPTFPDLTLHVREVRETSTDNPSYAVARAEVDVSLGLDYPDAPIERIDDVAYDVVARERFGVAGLAPSEDEDAVSLRELGDLDWVIPPPESNYGMAIRAACRQVGFEPRVRHLVTDTSMSLALAAAGAGVCLTTPLMQRFAGRAGHRRRELREPIVREILLVTRVRDRDRPAVTAFADAVRGVIGSFG